jgi:hypothetical protein
MIDSWGHKSERVISMTEGSRGQCWREKAPFRLRAGFTSYSPKRASAVLEAGQTVELNLGLFTYAGSKPFLRNKQGI